MSSDQGATKNQDQGNPKITQQEIDVNSSQSEIENQRAFQVLYQNTEIQQFDIIQSGILKYEMPKQENQIKQEIESLNIQPKQRKEILNILNQEDERLSVWQEQEMDKVNNQKEQKMERLNILSEQKMERLNIQKEQEMKRLNIQPVNIEIDQMRKSDQLHKHIELLDDFVDFIDEQYNNGRRSQPKYKYYFKIIFQILVYISTMIELIFTLLYGYVNNILEYEDYAILYYFSIFFTMFLHICVWIYTYDYMNVQINHLCRDLLNYCYSTLIGILSYLKLLPFLMFYTRDTSIQQFSFTQIYKILYEYQPYEYPCRLLKKRNKPVNIFRDLIFHSIALISMSITFLTQSIPMLVIQGLFNSYFERWDYFNIITYCFLIINVLNFITELQFYFLTFNLRTIYNEPQDQFRYVRIYQFVQIKQLLKVNESNLEKAQLYFKVDTSKLNQQEQTRCIILIIKCILKFRNLQKLEIQYKDLYELKTLQYLANALQFIEIDEIVLSWVNSDREKEQKNILKFNFLIIHSKTLKNIKQINPIVN